MTSARSKSQMARSNVVEIGKLAVAWIMSKDAGKRGDMKRFEKMMRDRIKRGIDG